MLCFGQKQKIATLQVRRFPYQKKQKMLSQNRVWLFISKRKTRGSFTLEASFCLTFFIFAVVILMMPMKIMNTRRQAQAALESAAEDLCRYAYIEYKIEQGDEGAWKGGSEAAKGFSQYFSKGVAQGYVMAKVLNGITTDAIRFPSLFESKILEEDVIDLVFSYEIQLPFPVLAVHRIPQKVRVRRRAWTGKDGKDYGNEDQTDTKDEIVYVGKDSTRYHRSRSCHYLSNKMSLVPFAEAKTLGYHKCARCAGSVKEGDQVFIMPSGRSFHLTRDCTAIIAYVRAVPLSEVEYLGECSYCGGK